MQEHKVEKLRVTILRSLIFDQENLLILRNVKMFWLPRIVYKYTIKARSKEMTIFHV